VFHIRIKLVLAALIVTLIGPGCAKKDEPKPQVAAPPSPAAAVAPAPAPSATAPAPQPAAAPAPAPAQSAVPAQIVLASQEYSQDPNLRCDILEVKRVSGGVLLIKWRLSRPAAAAAGGLTAQGDDKKIWQGFTWSNVYFTDPAENKKYSGLKDSGGNWIGQGEDKHYGAGEQQVIWMKFPAPPATSTKIAFVFPGFPPFDDLPVAQ
jgi:hypothetical protein